MRPASDTPAWRAAKSDKHTTGRIHGSTSEHTMPPGLAHALIALALQALVALPVWAVTRSGALAAAVGAVFALGFYTGRERRQSEEWWGSNRIPPWRWKPRAARDVAWPALAVVVACIVVGVA